MKVLYIGDEDFAAQGITARLGKEENDVYILTNKRSFKKGNKGAKHKYYYDQNMTEIRDVFLSVNPQVVIFAGAGYLKEQWGDEQKGNLSLLSLVLEECIRQKIEKFIFFSSIQVYGNISKETDESSKVSPNTVKGRWLFQGEEMVRIYQEFHGLSAVILRLSRVFQNRINSADQDFFGQLCHEEQAEETVQEVYLQPLHISDLGDAIMRVMVLEKSSIYNVCSTYQMKLSTLTDFLARQGACSLSIDGDPKEGIIRNGKIKLEQEWVDFWNLESLIEEDKIQVQVEKKQAVKEESRSKETKREIRRVIENSVIFAFFAMIYILTADHSLFSQVNWLLIYVMVISLAYSVRQGALAVALASITYLIVQQGNIFEITNFYSYVGNVLVIVEFIFFGIIIGYTVDMLREEKRVKEEELEILTTSYEKIKEINQKNIKIKNEYEKRILDGKNGLPRLYSMIRKVNVLDEDRIFMEVINIVKELMHTDTVAVYRANKDTHYLRLIAALNDQSLIEKRSWNLEKHPKIREAINNNMIYEGDVWKKEPAIVLPIVSSKDRRAVIVIKDLSFEQISLYSINMLRTLLLLISESLEKAFQYEVAMREQKYIKNTDILYPHEFKKVLELAKEKGHRKIADHLLIKIPVENNITETYEKVDKLFRTVDFFGMDHKGDLFVLLTNTSKEDKPVVIERLNKNGILVETGQKFQAGVSEADE